MSDTWSILGKARLQELIGDDVLARLEHLLPALKPDFDQIAIYSREGLSRIFDAFAGATSLEYPAFREELFNSLPPERLDSILKKVAPSTPPPTVWAQKVKTATSAWKEKESAKVIAEDLDISKDYLPQEIVLPPSEVVLARSSSPYKQLKDYQTSVYFRACEKINIERTRFIVQMPRSSLINAH